MSREHNAVSTRVEQNTLAALTATTDVVLAPRKSHLAANVLRKSPLIVVQVHVELPGALAEEPRLFVLTLINLGSVVGNTDRCPVVVVSRDGGVLHAGVALIARLLTVSNENDDEVGPFCKHMRKNRPAIGTRA